MTPPDLGSSFIGESPEFRRLLKLIELVAPSDGTVLITGETGAGKERVAKLIHARSPRRFRPFVVVECATLQESLLESELFGHERGAFTGADRGKPGLFEVANGGTIFLDEIGEVSPATQTKLLRVLDTSTFRHVGGTSEIRVDVRVLTATNRDVSSMVRQCLFREDLFYRLSTITVEVPPLRARGTDVELLAQQFVATLNERFGSSKRISEEALQLLRAPQLAGKRARTSSRSRSGDGVMRRNLHSPRAPSRYFSQFAGRHGVEFFIERCFVADSGTSGAGTYSAGARSQQWPSWKRGQNPRHQ